MIWIYATTLLSNNSRYFKTYSVTRKQKPSVLPVITLLDKFCISSFLLPFPSCSRLKLTLWRYIPISDRLDRLQETRRSCVRESQYVIAKFHRIGIHWRCQIFAKVKIILRTFRTKMHRINWKKKSKFLSSSSFRSLNKIFTKISLHYNLLTFLNLDPMLSKSSNLSKFDFFKLIN